jgi:hypothetical protein
VSATATDSGQVQFSADFLGSSCTYTPVPDTAAIANVVGAGPTYSTSLSTSLGDGCYNVHATATSSCSSATAAAAPFLVPSVINNCFLGAPPKAAGSRNVAAWSSDLSIDGARLQLVMNGTSAFYPGKGRTYGTVGVKSGENRVEVTVVEAPGKAGLWRFDLMSTQVIVPGSLHVMAGDVVSIAPTSVTFRLHGELGERVVFTFVEK